MEVSKERTGWRDDLRLNDRHRQWGWDCPAVDVDKLFIEYDQAKPVALVEYKHENAEPASSKHASIRALIEVGNRADLPVYGVRYANDFSWFKVVPLNNVAKIFLSERQQMTESEYVAFLYRLRGRTMPANLLRIES